MKECGVDSLDTLYTVIAELHMPDNFFRYWSETLPTTDKLIETLQQYRLCSQSRTVDSSCTLKPSITQVAKPRQSKSTNLHAQKNNNSCNLCHDGNHPLFLCPTFKAKSVEERFSTATKLKVCTNCLSYNHFCRDCPSRRSCKDCGARHHSLLHRQSSSTRRTEDADEQQTTSTSTNAHVTPTCNHSYL